MASNQCPGKPGGGWHTWRNRQKDNSNAHADTLADTNNHTDSNPDDYTNYECNTDAYCHTYANTPQLHHGHADTERSPHSGASTNAAKAWALDKSRDSCSRGRPCR
jgi:hypothetical protein